MKTFAFKLFLFSGLVALSSCGGASNDAEVKDAKEENKDKAIDKNDSYFIAEGLSESYFALSMADKGIKEQGEKGNAAAFVAYKNDLSGIADKLKEFAKSKAISAPDSLSGDQLRAISNTDNEESKKDVAARLKEIHTRIIEIFKKSSEKCDDTELRGFAESKLSDLQKSYDALTTAFPEKK